MSKDWYDIGRDKLLEEATNIVADNNEPEQIAWALYSFFSNIGLIDYDIEKDVIWDRYNEED